MSRGLQTCLAVSAGLMAAAGTRPATAQTSAQTGVDLGALQAEIEALKTEQARASARIAQLERLLATAPVADPPRLAQADVTRPPTIRQAAGTGADASPAAPVNPAGGSAPGVTPAPPPARLTVNGDLRVRYEANFGDATARDRDRGVLRGRLRAAYAINKWLTIGGQLGTGDPDDPNSTDITLANFDDDLSVSLDQAYVRLTAGNLQVFAGKIPQPFVRTELVWDGDISPQGVSGAYRFALGGLAARVNGLYFLIDEQANGPNSDMVGAQLAVETASARAFKVELAAGYYDYQLRSTVGGDAGDFRQNRFVNGRYVSDFDLLDVIGAVTWSGLGDAWPVRLVGDYVRNFGAADENTGFGVDLLLGRASKRGDFRFAYGYAQAGADAVLDVFSHDNTQFGSNYFQHSLSVDFVPAANVILNTTYYRYRPRLPALVGRVDWLDRLRLNLLVNF